MENIRELLKIHFGWQVNLFVSELRQTKATLFTKKSDLSFLSVFKKLQLASQKQLLEIPLRSVMFFKKISLELRDYVKCVLASPYGYTSKYLIMINLLVLMGTNLVKTGFLSLFCTSLLVNAVKHIQLLNLKDIAECVLSLRK